MLASCNNEIKLETLCESQETDVIETYKYLNLNGLYKSDPGARPITMSFSGCIPFDRDHPAAKGLPVLLRTKLFHKDVLLRFKLTMSKKYRYYRHDF